MNTLVRNLNGMPNIFNELLNENFANASSKSPSANIKETDDSFMIELAVPGLKKDDFKLEVHERNLKISSEKNVSNEEENEKYILREFQTTSFSKSFRLPLSIDTDNIEATYSEGVLQVQLPKKEEAKPKEPKMISIN